MRLTACVTRNASISLLSSACEGHSLAGAPVQETAYLLRLLLLLLPAGSYD